jgi:hypothetical protein
MQAVLGALIGYLLGMVLSIKSRDLGLAGLDPADHDAGPCRHAVPH